MRRWLQLGVASAGMGAALLGFSLVGPDPVTAGADTGAESSASSDSSDSSDSGSAGPSSSEGSDSDADDTDTDTETDTDTDEADADDAGSDVDTDNSESDVVDDEAALDETNEDHSSEGLDADGGEADADVSALHDAGDDPAEVVAESTNVVVEQPRSALAGSPIPDPPNPPYVSELTERQQRVADFLDEWTEKNQAWVNSLQISDAGKERLQASFLAMRRTFFNQAPTVAPLQLTGVITGSITGTVGAVDPDGDRMIYIVSKSPTTGTVKIAADGSFTYMPDEDFNGVDTFYVRAIDIGFHVNLLQPLRPVASGQATSLINQGAVKFEFHIKEADLDKWDKPKLDAMERAANMLVSYFRVLKPVKLTYDVTTFSNDSGLLAAAGSLYTSYDPGTWLTRVQHKLLTGATAPGTGDDGLLYVNFGKKWSFDDTLASDQNDFTMVIMHELLHSFGWVFAGDNAPYMNNRRYWSVYASLLVDKDGRTLWNDDHTWNTDFNPNLLRGNGGLFFGGANAVKANGGKPVPLVAFAEGWTGSTGQHLDDYSPSTAGQLMDAVAPAGTSIRVISPVEFGVLKDLGYTVVPQTIVAV